MRAGQTAEARYRQNIQRDLQRARERLASLRPDDYRKLGSYQRAVAALTEEIEGLEQLLKS